MQWLVVTEIMCNFLHWIGFIFSVLVFDVIVKYLNIQLFFDISTDLYWYESSTQYKSLRVSSSKEVVVRGRWWWLNIPTYVDLWIVFDISWICFSSFLNSKLDFRKKVVFLFSSSFDLIFASFHCQDPWYGLNHVILLILVDIVSWFFSI